jgi:hypothetical protein
MKRIIKKENTLVLTLKGVNFYVNQDTLLMEGWAQDRWDAKALRVFLVEKDEEFTYLVADNQLVIHTEPDSTEMSKWIDEYCAAEGYTRQPDILI